MKYILKGWVSAVDSNSMTSAQIKELIERRRRQVLVHSVIYYKLNENLITDSQWSAWALELEELQNTYPQIAAECCFADEFEGFEHSSGMDLPLENPWAVTTAAYLVRISREKQSPL